MQLLITVMVTFLLALAPLAKGQSICQEAFLQIKAKELKKLVDSHRFRGSGQKTNSTLKAFTNHIFAKYPKGLSQVVEGAGKGDLEAIRYLIAYNYGLNYFEDKANRTVLMIASLRGDINTINTVIDNGAMPDHKSSLEITALMFAAQTGQIEAIKTLIQRGAKVNYKNNQYWTALMYAAQAGQAPAVELLIDLGAEYTKDQRGESPLSLAKTNRHKEVVKVLRRKIKWYIRFFLKQ